MCQVTYFIHDSCSARAQALKPSAFQFHAPRLVSRVPAHASSTEHRHAQCLSPERSFECILDNPRFKDAIHSVVLPGPARRPGAHKVLRS
ncbi:hypothetical protein AAFF_G00082880 [Aldrovandia affinis]|uniref:Uncharacterized protein n=1 Tax=Aldrovandia affinis TaxID=143900 RepID=A0AAD7WCS9_9TELE|nr:hypothetical protein AAFF_G00082880 [Aldrovandia affinis]